MDYKEKYEKALERARERYANMPLYDLEYVFPEIKESENERMRKLVRVALLSQCDNLQDFYHAHETNERELIEWVNSHRREWTDHDEQMRDTAVRACLGMFSNLEAPTKVYEECISWLKDLDNLLLF